MEPRLMPSEIARLVYGYFLETGCEKSAKLFLEENPLLKEFAEGIKDGYSYSTTINCKTLVQTLNGDLANVKLKKTDTANNGNQNTSDTSKVIDNNAKKILLRCIDNLEQIKSGLSSLVNDDGKTDHAQISVDVASKNKQSTSSETSQTISPRRKCATPRKITQTNHNSISHNLKSQLEPSSQSSEQTIISDHSSTTEYSSPISSSDDLNVLEYKANKQLIFNEFLKSTHLQEKVASIINTAKDTRLKSNSNSAVQSDAFKQHSQPSTSVDSCNSNEYEVGNIEKDLLPPDVLADILNSILDEPELNELVENVIEKEIQEIHNANTPVKLFPSLNSNSTVNMTSAHKSIKGVSELQSDTGQQTGKDTVPSNKSNENPFESTQTMTEISGDQSTSQQELIPKGKSHHKPIQYLLTGKGHGFKRLRDKQRAVREAKQIASTSETSMTTSIEKSNNLVPLAPKPVATPLNQAPVTTLSNVIVSSWPNTLGGQFFIPPTQPIIYLNDSYQIVNYASPIASPSIQAANIVSLDCSSTSSSCASPSLCTAVPTTSESKVVQATERSIIKYASSQESKSKQRVETIMTSSELPNSSSPKANSPRPLPTILSKSRGKLIRLSPNNPDNTTTTSIVIDESVKEKSNQVMDARSIVSPSKSDAANNSANKPITLNSKTRSSSKRKAEESLIETSADNPKLNRQKSRSDAMIDTNDPKIKTLLNIDMDKFLGNIHSPSSQPNKTTRKSESKKGAL